MKKILVLLLSLMLALCFCFAGCEEIAGITSSGTSSSSGGDSSVQDDVPDGAYTVTLVLPDGVNTMPDLTGVQAVWSNANSTYTADFNSSGLAYREGLDGEYTVTLSGSVDGYTYNPNGYTAYGTESGRQVEIQLLTILSFTGGDGSGKYSNSAQAYSTGAYRIEFTSAGQEFYFNFLPVETSVTYTIETYVSVTENEMCPWVNVYLNSSSSGGAVGGYSNGKESSVNNITFTATASGTYTKNFAITKDYPNASTQSGYCFAFGITTMDEDYSEPKYMDIYITSEGKYDDSVAAYEKVAVEPYNSNYTAPTGSITWVSDICNGDFTNCDVNYHDDDGYWYITYGGKEYLLYVELKSCHYGADVGYNFTERNWYICGEQYLAYADVITAYISTATSNNYHPVTSQLKEFLNYRAFETYPILLFFDGSGVLENSPYNLATDGEHGWLFACGFYING